MLTQLKLLTLRENNLSGKIPESLGNLSQLEYLLIDFNSLEDSIPGSLEGLQNLKSFSASLNNLNGEVPQAFENLVSLEYLDLSFNILTGDLPDLSNSNLIELNLQSNFFSETFNLNNISNWTSINIKNNKFTFEDIIPYSSFGPLFEYTPQKFVYVDTAIYINQLGQDITINLGFDQGISDNTYNWYKDGELVETIFGNNEYTIIDTQSDDIGNYFCEITNTNAPELTLISHTIQIALNIPCYESDSIALVDLYLSTGGPTSWIVDTNWLSTEPISNWHGVITSGPPNNCVTFLALIENNLTGELPNLNLPYLEALFLSSNNLSGAIPPFSELTNLQSLFLNDNNFEGELPNFNGMEPLLELYIGQNENLTGPIPNLSMPSLITFDFSYCGFTQIPNFTNLPSLVELSGYNNSLTGNLPPFSNCPNLQVIQLSNNDLDGSIPPYSQELFIFSVESNDLSDTLPNILSTKTGLVWLDVSNNNLEGKVPDFSTLPNLVSLVLNNNSFIQLPDHGDITSWFSASDCPGTSCGFIVSNNVLSFDDILPNMVAGDYGTWLYTPQDSFLTQTEHHLPISQAHTIDLGIDESITDNEYQWFKNGNTFPPVLNKNQLTITAASTIASDTFHVQVNNPNVPDLTLYSRATIIHACEPEEVDQYHLLCDGETLTINNTEYNLSNPTGTEYIDVSNEVGCDSILHIQLEFHPRM